MECQGRSKLDIRNPESQVKEMEIGHPDTEPIPTHNMRAGHQSQPNTSRLVRLASSGDNKAVSGTTRAVNSIAVGRCDQVKQDDCGGRSLLNYITVKGVKLDKKKMVAGDKKKMNVQTNNKKKKNNENEMMKPVPSSGGIKRYLVRKHEDNDDIQASTSDDSERMRKISPLEKNIPSQKEDRSVRGMVTKFEKLPKDMKKTFTSVGENARGISKKINEFNNLSETNGKCLIGSGRCASHNTRVVRVVQHKKTSVVNKDGSIGWKMCEAVILACPVGSKNTSAVSNMNLSDNEDVIANKRARVNVIIDVSQSDLSKLEKEEACDVTTGLK